jgi:nucleoside transporter
MEDARVEMEAGAPAGLADVTGAGTAPPMSGKLRLQLSIMMFLQFAIWGSWFVFFVPYLGSRGFSRTEATAVFGNMALGAIFSTLFAGYIADRLFSSERLMAVFHLVGAGLLYWMSQIQSPSQYGLLFGVSLAYALVYNPTLALANSISFTHIPNATRDFPMIRVLGTIGWIVVGMAADRIFRPAGSSNGPLQMAAVLSAVLGVFSLFLPHTPPAGKAGDAIPILKALALFKDYSFAVFFIVSFVITIVLAFYYAEAGDFLKQRAEVEDLGSVLGIGQWAELFLMLALPLCLRKMGMKWVLAMGMLAWGVRYYLFSIGGPEGFPWVLVLLGVALHGVCFDFFFAAGFIHVDNEAPRDIRASGQALFSFLTYGVGMWLGSVLSGRIADAYTVETVVKNGEEVKIVDWQHFWQIPSLGVLASLLIFVVFFRMHSRTPTASSGSVKE